MSRKQSVTTRHICFICDVPARVNGHARRSFLMPTNKKETDVKMLWHWFGCGTYIACYVVTFLSTRLRQFNYSE